MSSEVVSGIPTQADLSESERVALIAFKTALNEQLPTIIPETAEMTIHADANPSDESFLYLLNTYVLNDSQIGTHPELQGLKDLYTALPENTQPIKLPEQESAAAIASLSGSEQALAEFKSMINERLPEILPETAGMSIHINGDALDGSYTYLLQHYILNEEALSATPELSELRDLYNQLPEDIRVKTDTYRQFFTQPEGAQGIKNQGAAVIGLAERYLGTNDAPPVIDEETGLVQVDERTARALRERLEQLKETETDINIEFDPRVFDQRTVDFMNAVTAKRQREAGVQPENTTNFLTQLWALEIARDGGATGDTNAPSRAELAFGEASSLNNILGFMVNGELPSGSAGSRPNSDVTWDSQWTNHDSGDRFFSTNTYRDLYNNKTVTTDVLFDRGSYSEENYDILLTAQERLGMTMERGVVLSEMEVGQLAAEILSIRAQKEWCFINPGEEFDETKIHEMIHDEQFMPHLDDLFLAEKGFGLPETEYFRQKVEEYGPEESWRLEYEERAAVIGHRSRAFAERFGDMPDDAVQERAEIFQISDAHVRHSYGLPSLYFRMPRDEVTQQTPYEQARDQYLIKYQEFKEDVGSCDTAGNDLDTERNPDLDVTDGGPCTVEGVLRGDNGTTTDGNSGPCTVEGVLRGDEFNNSADADETSSDCIKTNIEDATGNPQGDCTVEDEVMRRLERDAALQQ